MLRELRLVILDFPKKHLENETSKKIISDMLSARQISFRRTIESYILMDKNDMLATHFLIYDVSNLYLPKILSGIRVVYNSRCKQYGLKLPLDENIEVAPLPVQLFYNSFKQERPDLPECTGWFVDSDFSYSKTKIDLAQILFFMVTTYLFRQGIDYFSGATNERYKASRWVSKVGPFKEGFSFMHPTIPYEHKLTLVEAFDKKWMADCFDKYGDLIHSTYELTPDHLNLRSIDDIENEIRNRQTKIAS